MSDVADPVGVVGTPHARRVAVAAFPPPIAQNPYQRLLYAYLERQGLPLAAPAKLRLSWLWRSRAEVGALHFHWPQPYYRADRGATGLRPLLSWIRLGLFAVRLASARVLRYRIVWTVHQVLPHERAGQQLDEAAASLLARSSNALIVHDLDTAEVVTERWPRLSARIAVIPHGSYVGVYPPGRARGEVRRELDLRDEAVVFLCFGELRKYKSLDLLLTAFAYCNGSSTALLVAGAPRDAEVVHAIERAAAGDRSVRTLLEFVPDERVAELFDAADGVVFPRSDGGTSGSIVLALSFGKAVIASNCPAYVALTRQGLAGWHFRPGDARSLADAIARAAAGEEERGEKGKCALEIANSLDWNGIADQTAALLVPRGARAGERGRVGRIGSARL